MKDIEKSPLFIEMTLEEAAAVNGGAISKGWYKQAAISTASFAARTALFGFNPLSLGFYVLTTFPPTIEVE